MDIERRRSKDIVQLLKLLDIEQYLGDIEPGELVYFLTRKMSFSTMWGRCVAGPGMHKEVTIRCDWRQEYSDTGMFLKTDAWHMSFLVGDRIIEVSTKDFGSLWTIKKIDR